MSGQIIEIQSDNLHLSCERGFMTVSSEGQDVAKIPMSDVEAVITASHGISYSNNLLVRLAEENIPFVFCNKKFLPVGFLWSVAGQYRQAGVMDAQIAVHEKSRDKLWKEVVKKKIYFQYKVLETLALPHEPLKQMIARLNWAMLKILRDRRPESILRLCSGVIFAVTGTAAGLTAC